MLLRISAGNLVRSEVSIVDRDGLRVDVQMMSDVEMGGGV